MAKQAYIQANKDWLEAKAREQGVRALPKGIYYKVLSEGNADGTKPTVRSIITAHYTGWTIDGKKFSGNAQYLRHGRVMHHGTLLYNSDLSAVSKALQVDPEKIRAKGIESVRSRVTNIRRYMKEEVPLFVFREMLLDFIRRETESEDYEFSEEDVREIERIRRERYDTWEWNYGKSPECTILKSGRVEGCGTIEAFITTDRGLITGIAFYGDFFSTKDPEELTQYFIGKKPDTEGFTQALEGIAVEQYFTGLTKEELLKLLSGE